MEENIKYFQIARDLLSARDRISRISLLAEMIQSFDRERLETNPFTPKRLKQLGQEAINLFSGDQDLSYDLRGQITVYFRNIAGRNRRVQSHLIQSS